MKSVQAVALCPSCGKEVFVSYSATKALMKGQDSEARCRNCDEIFSVEPINRRS